jgi:hypothetical protein
MWTNKLNSKKYVGSSPYKYVYPKNNYL